MRSRFLLTIALTLLCVTSAQARLAPDRTLMVSDRAEVIAAARSAMAVERILEIRLGAWACQDAVELERAKASHGRAALLAAGLRFRGWVADRWRAVRAGCEKIRRVTLPNVGDWLVAVKVAQRAYPGTEGWLLSCSAPRSEGGWGRWLPNSRGSGAGGWMQFMEGTFWRMWSSARAELTARGFRVPASAASWYSPLGQALAAAWGLLNGRAHEWTGSGC